MKWTWSYLFIRWTAHGGPVSSMKNISSQTSLSLHFQLTVHANRFQYFECKDLQIR